MRRGSRVVVFLVLCLLMQAVAPGAFASCAGSEHTAMMQTQSADHPCADKPDVKKVHDCCDSETASMNCTGSDCASGSSQSVTVPVSQLYGLVITHDQQSVDRAAFMPAAPPAFRFRPPIA